MSPRRRVLVSRGARGDMAKAVEDRSEQRVVVYYRDGANEPRRRTYPLTPAGRAEAKAFVIGWHEEKKRQARPAVAADAPPVLTHELWTQFSASELAHLRGATILSYRYHWRRWESFIGRETPAGTVTVADCSRFRAAAQSADASLNQARQTLQIVRGIYRWAVGAQLLVDRGVLAFRWKRGKDDPRSLEPAEYSASEYGRLLGALDRDDARQWRAWVFLMIAGHHGQRARAVLHLRWQDIDLERGVIVWPGKYQKQGVDLVQPLLWESISALRTAQLWRDTAATYRVRAHHKSTTAGPDRLATADWILFAERDKARAMSYTSLHYHLIHGERRAKVKHLDYRAAHGFRRMVVGEVGERSGDRMLGLEYVGDRDPKMLASYDRRRQNRIDGASSFVESVRITSGQDENANADGKASALNEANPITDKGL